MVTLSRDNRTADFDFMPCSRLKPTMSLLVYLSASGVMLGWIILESNTAK